MADIIPLGRRLREHREERGISQAQAARELDVARTAYRLWELEAARPSSDRWRSISTWLGISVAALLLSEELAELGEAENLERITRRLRDQGMDWEEASAKASGDYFAQERATIRDQKHRGTISSAESDRLNEMLHRIEAATGTGATSTWRTAEFRKDLVGAPEAIPEARAALAVTASGVPTETMAAAGELLEALLQDATGADGSPAIIALRIEVGRRTLRVEASDRASLDDDGADGPGWRYVMNHASRWGATGRGRARARWFEIDLPEPGEPSR
jgi:transcriptional regulator with XRE-family HTH domain